ncbi:MAG TPA: hypothetical protein VMN57_16065 [Anaerolineales bacterium]|nr:hypothetical protein [Anaerolineales bacterium]
MSIKVKIISITVLLIAGLLPGLAAQAQVSRPTWSEPFRISSIDQPITDHTVYADPYGYAHLFWVEILPDNRPIIKYSRFDGGIWTVPIGIHIGFEDHTIKTITPVLTPDNTLHLFWAQGILVKRLVRSSVPLDGTLNAQNWAQAKAATSQQVVETIKMVVDSEGVFHMVYTRTDGQSKGVYYIKSADQGSSWTNPVWIDPDTPAGYVPGDLTLAIDDADGLHAVWDYGTIDFSPDFANMIRYAGLAAGDPKWSLFMMDRVNPESDDEYQLNAASPVLAVSGQKVIVIWAGGTLNFRHFRFSDDAGRTWSSSTRFMGNLNGQAGDGLAVDGSGRIHYFTQIRFPVGIYHSVFTEDRWTSPTIVYFIRYAGEARDNVEAHRTYAAVRAGNQIVLTFTDPPPFSNRGLYVMTAALPDIEPLELPVLPTPIPTQMEPPTATPPPTIGPALEAAPQTTDIAPQPVLQETPQEGPENPEQTLVAGMLFSVLILIGIAGVRIIIKR